MNVKQQHNTDNILLQLKQKYVLQKSLVFLLQSLAVAFIVIIISYKLLNFSPLLSAGLGFFAGVLTFAIAALISAIFKTNLQAVARHLNRKYPELEESCELLLQPGSELNLVEQLQANRIRQKLDKYILEKALDINFLKPLLLFFLGLGVAMVAYFAPSNLLATTIKGNNKSETVTKEVVASLPAIQKVSIMITPPTYTKVKAYEAASPNFKAEKGSKVNWKIITDKAVDTSLIVFNDAEIIKLKPSGNTKTEFSHSATIFEAGFYYLVLNGIKSDYYALEVIDDNAPQINIIAPEQHTLLEFGDKLSVVLEANLQDDYGIKNANIVATVAKGSGEAVKFREEVISLNQDFSAALKNYKVTKVFDLPKLGMEWGDELYFYIQTWDNHKGYTRSETYFIQMEDTAIVESMDDMTMGVNPVPEYFRSQRQIIIDTEKLVAERSKLTEAVFNERSNNIGVDQKILRLRYGKFLGEEFESTIGGVTPAKKEKDDHEGEDHDDHEDHEGHDHEADDHSGHDHAPQPGGSSTFNDPAALLDPYMHKHDVEEAATFFEPAVKAQLKAALAQMWEAELRLRINRPKEALPFEYKALKLLKEVQHKSRAYVRKTGFDAPPIKVNEKRLTGELDKIFSVKHKESIPQDTSFADIRKALLVIENYRTKGVISAKDRTLLEKAGQELVRETVNQPGKYLQALQDLRLIINESASGKIGCKACLSSIDAAFIALLPVAPTSPAKAQVQANPMADKYFKNR